MRCAWIVALAACCGRAAAFRAPCSHHAAPRAGAAAAVQWRSGAAAPLPPRLAALTARAAAAAQLDGDEFDDAADRAGGSGNAAAPGPQGPPPPPVLYKQRWVQLAYLSMFALLSDWVCFSIAAAPSTWQTYFGHDPATLIDVFLFTNVAGCLLVSDTVRRFGLRTSICTAGFVMTAGCFIRAGLGDLIGLQWALPSYSAEVVGTILVGAAQPFFQCTPPALSAAWFGSNERALATAVAINFNQVGIATAFLVGGAMGQTVTGLDEYFWIIACASFFVSLAAAFNFEERPPTPPSASAGARAACASDDEPCAPEDAPRPFFETAQDLLSRPSFAGPLVAFVASISISNVVSAFLDDILRGAGFADQTSIDVTGAAFQFAIVLGGIALGGYVDRSKNYKSVTLGCLAVTAAMIVTLGSVNVPAIVFCSLLALGATAGPIQPINAELAVEVTYPNDESAIEALQQVFGNLFSALLLPVAEIAATKEFALPGASGDLGSALGLTSISGDTLVLLAVALVAFRVFYTFDAPLLRTELDELMLAGATAGAATPASVQGGQPPLPTETPSS